ncbi:DUF4282 domain-containing protein [Devosia rhodophyticola]|uniref:DUF4282 domain-containing protein n=1 Tax=Devosia rhodophyticola TaxID=3026423 RepID=A0ABY7YX26_9HYPH|nr:DUF4282 domain-containing protein [Devosia rhodophyticola]WDR05933.1 DUF4282 domain-containing protein [Devosia rhodophyticola]
MTLDDLKRLFTRQTLFRLDAILAPKLVPILYALGLASILLWVISSIFFSFSFGFGSGLWGLLEILVFGLLAWIGLRIGCEALLVFFKAHEVAGETVNRSRFSASLLDEVRDAIRDLAEQGGEDEDDDEITPATEPAPFVAAPATAPGNRSSQSGRQNVHRPSPKTLPDPKHKKCPPRSCRDGHFDDGISDYLRLTLQAPGPANTR